MTGRTVIHYGDRVQFIYDAGRCAIGRLTRGRNGWELTGWLYSGQVHSANAARELLPALLHA